MAKAAKPGTNHSAPLRGLIIPPQGGVLRPFLPGQSGSPGGPGVTAYNEARAICAKATPDAARKQIELMSSHDERVAFMATEAVLNRGAGKPRDHSNEDAAPQRINLSNLSADKRATLATLLREALGVTD